MTGRATATVLTGSNLDLLPQIPTGSIDAIVTDPPYGLAFMGRNWDKALPDPRTWAECFRVLKPGGHMVAFGAPRLYHRLAVQIEDSAPWEIRDCLMWLYGSGFPKNHDVSRAIDKAAGAEREVIGSKVYGDGHVQNSTKTIGFGGCDPEADKRVDTAPATDAAAQWEGWGTALKPAWEPILLARKPLDGTVARNVQAHGTGAMNIDGCRVACEPGDKGEWPVTGRTADRGSMAGAMNAATTDHSTGRWPANLILDEEAGAALDAEVGNRRSSGTYNKAPAAIGFSGSTAGAIPPMYDDSGGPSRFFYCAKASRSEREAGLDDFTGGIVNDGRATSIDNPYQRGDTVRKNRHPTVKPVALMRWLVRLITPPGGIVLDPFNGSGSTGCAAMAEGFNYLGIELDPEHAETARERIAHWSGDARVHTPMERESANNNTAPAQQLEMWKQTA